MPARVGLPQPQPGRRGWPTFHAMGEQLHEDGWRGPLVPSAARPDSQILVAFLVGATIPAELVPTSATRITEPPVPPTGMWT